MKKLDSKDLIVSRKVRKILEEETSILNNLENIRQQGNRESEVSRPRGELLEVSEMPILISSFEEEITSASNGMSSFFEGEISNLEATGISPILVAKSPLLQGINEEDARWHSKLDEEERKCNFCPIC